MPAHQPTGTTASRPPRRVPGALLRLPWVALLLAGCPAGGDETGDPPCTLSQPAPYPSGSPYVGLHGNRENNNRIRCRAATANEPGWEALAGHLIFQPISIGPAGDTIYANAARIEGCKLFAVDVASGDVRWCVEELTVGAMAGTPEVDRDGNLYVTDGYRLGEPGEGAAMISFTADGEERWRTSLEDLGASVEPAGYRSPAGLHLTPGGHAATVTVDGVVALLDREDGTIVGTLDVPAATGYGPVAQEIPDVEIPSVVMDRLEEVIGPLEPEEVSMVFGASSGDSGAYSDNTVGLSSLEQLFLVGGGPDEETGALVAVDIADPAAMEVAWTLEFAGGSATSPAISPDGGRLVIGDGDAHLLLVDVAACNANEDGDPDPHRCAEAWSTSLRGGGLLGSAAIDEEGVITAWHGGGAPEDPDLFSLRDAGDHAELLWEVSFPADEDGVDVQWTSVSTVFDDVIIGTITTMESVITDSSGMPMLLQGFHEVTAVDRATGDVLWRVPIADDSINSPAIGPEGAVYVPLFGMLDLLSLNEEITYQGGIVQLLPGS